MLIFSFLLLGTTLLLQLYLQKRDNDFVRITVFAKKALHQEESRSNKFVDWLGNVLSKQTNFSAIDDSLLRNVEKPQSDFYYFIYNDDSLIYWSNNSVSFPYDQVKSGLNQQLILLKNGWYELFRYARRNITIIGLLPVKTNYTFQNNYLRNQFNPIFDLPDHAQLVENASQGTYPVLSSTGNYLFSIKYNPDEGDPSKKSYLALMYLLGCFLLIYSLYLFSLNLLRTKPLFAFLIFSIVILLRWLSIQFGFPALLYNSPLFNPKFYATSFFLNSLGDFLLSVTVFCASVLFIYRYLHFRKEKIQLIKHNKALLSVAVVGNLLFTFLFSVFINYLLSGLILNSKISFNVNNIFELTSFSLVGFLIIGILLFTFYVSCEGTVRFVQYGGFAIAYNFLLFLITQGLFLIILIWMRESEVFVNYGVSTFLLTNSLILFISYIRYTTRSTFSVARFMLVVFGFSVYAAQTISDFNQRREKNNMQLLLNKVENREDLIAEFLFQEIEQNISNDNFLTAYFTSGVGNDFEDKIKKRISLLYFSQVYWSRYDIRVKAFDSCGTALFRQIDTTRSIAYFDTLIANNTRPTYSNAFSYLNTPTGRIAYIGKIIFKDKAYPTKTSGTLIIELDSKFFQEEGGFPDLLLSDKMPAVKDISNYSYAKYQDNKLIVQNGKFDYYINPSTYEKLYGKIEADKFVVFSGYTHLFHLYGNNQRIIISHKNPTFLEALTLFSYVFIFFSVTFIALYLLQLLVRSNLNFQLDFRKRIQLSVIAVVVVAILLIGGGSIYYIIKGYTDEQKLRIKERLSSLLVAVENEVEEHPLQQATIADESAFAFSKISNTLGTDFNLYSKSGRLMFSTQSKIFDQEIISNLMNRQAYDQLVNYQATNFIHDEQIGTLDFTSAYETVRNNENKVVGFLNLPYFARQNELKREISGFLVTLINIYVLLFGVAVILTFAISNRLVKPLNVIQQRLGKIKLGRSNELIEWEAKDEIGSLVNEYNKMVAQLTESAEALAQSERETAWREMAKQVAHEIKNPLTPMKLSMQHLHRAYKEKNENFDEIFNRVSGTLIEQIDSLSRIATEFSNFAKMPRGNYDKVDLVKTLKSNIDLYSETSNINFIFNNEVGAEAIVFGDREQLLRVFTNLIKNAIQSIPENIEGSVAIYLKQKDNNYHITVADNGKGIPEDVKPKIFTPNFTTKSGGTGLGLAMVKSIIENMNGKIWFESEQGNGTSFFITIPAFLREEN